MPAADPAFLTFEYRLRYRGRPGMDHGQAEYPMRWEVTVDETSFTDSGDWAEVRVGSALVYVVPKAGMVNLSHALGDGDQPLARVAEMLSVDRPDLITRYLQDGGDLMIVSSLQITPAFRGHKTGYTVLSAVIETVGRAVNLVVLDAGPTCNQEDGKSKEDADSNAWLKTYWQGFGFEEAAGDYLAFANNSLAS